MTNIKQKRLYSYLYIFFIFQILNVLLRIKVLRKKSITLIWFLEQQSFKNQALPLALFFD